MGKQNPETAPSKSILFRMARNFKQLLRVQNSDSDPLSCLVLFLHPCPHIIACQTSHPRTGTNPQSRSKRHAGNPVQQPGHKQCHQEESDYQRYYLFHFQNIYHYFNPNRSSDTPSPFPMGRMRLPGILPACVMQPACR